MDYKFDSSDNNVMYHDGNTTINISGNGKAISAEETDDTPQCLLFKFLVDTILVGILGIVGFVGNSLSFLVLKRDRRSPVASFLLQSLAVADNSFLIFWMIHYSIRYLLQYAYLSSHSNVFHPAWLYIRVYTFPLMYMAQMATIWLTVTIALNRFMAVCMPYKAPQFCSISNVYKEVILVTLFSVSYNVPRFLELKVESNENGTISWSRTALGSSYTYVTVYRDVLYYLFSFILPLLLLAVINTKVTIVYQAARKRKRRIVNRRNDRDNITLVMIIVVLVFMLCQAPARIVQLAWSYSYNHCHQYQFYLIHISNVLEVLNSSVNFFIYFIFRRRFRNIFWENFCYRSVVSKPKSSTRITTIERIPLVAIERTTVKEQMNQNRDSISKRTEHPVIIDDSNHVQNIDILDN